MNDLIIQLCHQGHSEQKRAEEREKKGGGGGRKICIHTDACITMSISRYLGISVPSNLYPFGIQKSNLPPPIIL
jgi:hypothetical protein